jgi:catechol 2,3-dioxygenase-like lactoylglutathione lyase family enzyme
MNYDKVDHISYSVSDLDRSIDFYTLLLNEKPFLRKLWDQEYASPLCGYPGVVLEGAFWNMPDGNVLELLEFKTPPAETSQIEIYKAGSSHLGLACGDLRAEFARLRDAGVTFQSSDVVEIPWGPYKGGLAVFARDPDGTFIELIQVPSGGPRME